jgi:hypothetical protein
LLCYKMCICKKLCLNQLPFHWNQVPNKKMSDSPIFAVFWSDVVLCWSWFFQEQFWEQGNFPKKTKKSDTKSHTHQKMSTPTGSWRSPYHEACNGHWHLEHKINFFCSSMTLLFWWSFETLKNFCSDVFFFHSSKQGEMVHLFMSISWIQEMAAHIELGFRDFYVLRLWNCTLKSEMCKKKHSKMPQIYYVWKVYVFSHFHSFLDEFSFKIAHSLYQLWNKYFGE